MNKIHLIILCFSCVLIYSCRTPKDLDHTIYTSEEQLRIKNKNSSQVPYLKAHLKNGGVYTFGNNWHVDTSRSVVEGVGKSYDHKRRLITRGDLLVSIDSVALFETNQKLKPSEVRGIGALTILAGVNTAIGLYCVSNPKACFGSCPTFYTNPQSNIHNADAEGFSNAISPSMAYTDIDDLSHETAVNDSVFDLFMKNEALETHCVKSLQILAIEKGEDKVYQSNEDRFYQVSDTLEMLSALGSEGDIRPLIESSDLNERFSLADSVNLSSKEELYFTFSDTTNVSELGLIIGFRQTLMTTYFIYSAMGYMGDKVGEYFAEIENSGDAIQQLKNGLKEELGNIQVYVWSDNENEWQDQGGFYETGPIAINQQIIKIKNRSIFGKELKFKVVLNKGLWRIDNVHLAAIKSEVYPVKISASSVWKNNQNFTETMDDLESRGSIISMPGDEFKFQFKLPNPNASYALFLQSEGYYLEWMRESWLKEKNILTLRQMLLQPEKYLKQQSTEFKVYEQTMEEVFWGSRIDTKTFSYENQ